MDSEPQTRIAAEDYLDALAANGIDHLFCNPGTDFAPIVEAFARAARTNCKVPRPMVVPHENAAMSMAHGLLTSGRTPFTEAGAEGSRSAHIHWAQEMYDQAGMLREMVKWDYEMKRGDQVATVVDRALELAMASPKGPVYLSLPREVLGEVVHVSAESNRAHRARPRAPVPSAADIEQLAGWIANARAPVVITSLLGQDPRDAVVRCRARNSRRPVHASCRSARIRCTRVIRCAAFPLT
jgi:acetolactate synthase-1/2/3 large subunit